MITTRRSNVANIDQLGQVNTGDINVSTEAPVDVTPAKVPVDRTTDFTVPACAKLVQLENIGGLNPATSTLDGTPVSPGFKLCAKEGYNGVERIQLGAYDIVTNGSRWVGHYLI